MVDRIRINREELLGRLQSVSPGLAAREIIEQSSCFIFKDGKVITFNDEVSCSSPSGLPKEVEGAITAKDLLQYLESYPDEEIHLDFTDDELRIYGKGRKSGVRLESEILLNVTVVDSPSKWKKLPDDFDDALSLVSTCASRDDSRFSLTCIHFHPEWLEACDNYQMARWTIKTGIKEPFLVRQPSLKLLMIMGMLEIGETQAWSHFRNPKGLVLSCRRYLEEYPELTSMLEVKGSPLTLRKGIEEAVKLASIASSKNIDDDKVIVDIRPGKMIIRGEGSGSWHEERRKLKDYDGPELKFMISPKMLAELVKKHNSCLIDGNLLHVDGGKYSYCSALSKVKEKTAVEEAPTEEPTGEE